MGTGWWGEWWHKDVRSGPLSFVDGLKIAFKQTPALDFEPQRLLSPSLDGSVALSLGSG